MDRTISAELGKGSVNHNSRKFCAENVDRNRTHLNIDYCNERIQDVYHELFDEALCRYNEKQTRSDRRIANYYEKIRSGNQEKPFHELVLQIGNKDDMSATGEYAELAKQVLDEYYQNFQARNPNLRVFSAHLHMDEATPHIHIDFVPFVTGSKRGLDVRVSLKQALAAQGFKGGTKGNTEWAQWVQSEKEQLAIVMEQHELQWSQKGIHREHLPVLEFKRQERVKEVQELDSAIEVKSTQLEEIEHTLKTAQQQAVDLEKVDSVSVKKALLSDKVTLPRSDFENLLSAAKQYVVYRRQDEQLQGLLDAANAKIKQLEGIVQSLKQKVMSLTAKIDSFEAWHNQELQELKGENREVRRENLMLKRVNNGLTALLRRHGIDTTRTREREQELDER